MVENSTLIDFKQKIHSFLHEKNKNKLNIKLIKDLELEVYEQFDINPDTLYEELNNKNVDFLRINMEKVKT